METIAIIKLEKIGILVDLNPYETLIPKLSRLEATPINKTDSRCIYFPLWVSEPLLVLFWNYYVYLYIREVRIMLKRKFSYLIIKYGIML